MSTIVNGLDSEIRDIETVEDLDEFEENILKFMRKRNFSTAHVSRDIDYRRERLADEGRMERRESYRSSGTPFADKSMSDGEIRSMFRGLSRN